MSYVNIFNICGFCACHSQKQINDKSDIIRGNLRLLQTSHFNFTKAVGSSAQDEFTLPNFSRIFITKCPGYFVDGLS